MDKADDLLKISREVTDGGRTVRLELTGEIDAATVHLVEDALSAAFDEGFTQLVVDLSAVDFMDSSGLNVLIVVRNTLDDRGLKLVIAGVSDQVRRLFELSGLTTAFTFAS
jgi:anti-anti-sigma factor